MSKYNYRLYYYEDDVVTYNSRGTRPVIPKKYEYCNIKLKFPHKLKCFVSKVQAEIALKYKLFGKNRFCNLGDTYTIFKCPICGTYHIMLTSTYNNQFINKYNV